MKRELLEITAAILVTVIAGYVLITMFFCS